MKYIWNTFILRLVFLYLFAYQSFYNGCYTTNHYHSLIVHTIKTFFCMFYNGHQCHLWENNGRRFCLTKDEMKGDIKQKPNQFRNFALISQKNQWDEHYLKSLELCLKCDLTLLYTMYFGLAKSKVLKKLKLSNSPECTNFAF